MSDIAASVVNADGYDSTGHVREFEIPTDATGNTGPTPNEVLLSDYAACFTYAFRAAADRTDAGDPGEIQTEAEGDIDDDDDLTAVRFSMHVEADFDDATVEELLEGAEDICHVHAAVKPELHADVTVETGV